MQAIAVSSTNIKNSSCPELFELTKRFKWTIDLHEFGEFYRELLNLSTTAGITRLGPWAF